MPIEGIYTSTSFDLQQLFGEPLAAQADRIVLLRPEEVSDPDRITFALAWQPAPDAFASYPNLRLVSSIAAGADSILACPSLPAEAHVTRIVDPAQAETMAAFVAWHVVHHHRGMGRYIGQQSQGRWKRHGSRTPSRCTIGILGFGAMGQAVVRPLTAMGYRVIAAARSTRDADVELVTGGDALATVAARADILINLLPRTSATEGFIDADFIATMKSGSTLLHFGRGQHLDEQALLAALASGHLAGASLDVFATEPLPTDHPFWTHPLIVVTPHDAADASAPVMAAQLADAVEAVVDGRAPEHAVDRRTGY